MLSEIEPKQEQFPRSTGMRDSGPLSLTRIVVVWKLPYRPEFFVRLYFHFCSSGVHYCEDHPHLMYC